MTATGDNCNRSPEEVIPWFILKGIPGIGNLLFKRLYDRFGSPDRVLSATASELARIEGMTDRLVRGFKACKLRAQDKRSIDLAIDNGYRIVTMSDGAYPGLLHHIPDPPPILYVAGRIENLSPAIAVVGSRHATPYGLTVGRRLSRDLAALKFTVVSGMALGIDTVAHEGALMAKGKTVAVLGSGLDNIYPAENRRLFHRIAASGAVISEFAPRTKPEAYHFPARNRIISGMSLGTVVVEATRRSGSLITARLAAEQNREVYAVPGSIQSFKSTGTHTLIKQGAKLVESAGDVIEELGLTAAPSHTNTATRGNGPPKRNREALDAEQALVFEALGAYPVHIDDMVRQLKIPAGRLSSILLQLEVSGWVMQLPGKRFAAAR